MKLLSVKKLKNLHFIISYSFATNKYKREFLLCKQAYKSFLGIPLYPTKLIFVEPNSHDLCEVGA